MKVDGPPAYEASIAESSIFPPHFTPLGSPLLQNVKEATNSVLLMDNEVGSTESDQHLPPLPDTKLNSPVSDSDPGYQSATLSSIPREEKRCSLFPQHSAVWIHTVTDTHLSALSAAVLIHEGVFTAKNLELYKFSTSPPDPGPSDPISGVFAAAHATIGGVVMGVADYPLMITKMIKERRPVAKGMAVEFALDGGKGISRIIGTGLNAPMEFTLGLSRGFHNVPKIYGDETVRSEERVSGMKDGLIAGGKVSALLGCSICNWETNYNLIIGTWTRALRWNHRNIYAALSRGNARWRFRRFERFRKGDRRGCVQACCRYEFVLILPLTLMADYRQKQLDFLHTHSKESIKKFRRREGLNLRTQLLLQCWHKGARRRTCAQLMRSNWCLTNGNR
jgi:hypothetical protein